MKKLFYFIAGLIVLTLAVIVVGLIPPSDSLGSVTVGNEYNSTTSKTTLFDRINTLKTGSGALGSVIISITNTSNLILYDATTTNTNLRAVNLTTSSLPVLASFGISPTVGTYVYDTIFFNGLLMVFNGAPGSTTITWR